MAYKIGVKIGIEGEKEYKQALRELNQDNKVLASEMKLVASEFDKTDKSEAALAARSAVLAKQIDAQADKVKALKAALANASQSFGENDTRTKRWAEELNKAQADLNGMQRELKETNSELSKSKLGFDDFGSAMKKAGQIGAASMAAITAAAIAAGKALVDMAVGAAASADNILTLSAQTGIETDKIQEYQYAADLVDVSTETITKSMAKQIKSMKAAQDGTLLSVEAYQKLGIEAMNADGTLRDSQTVYWEVIDALGKMENETERDGIAMQLLGKSAQELNPLIKAGASRMQELAEQAHAAGYVMDKETLAAYGRLDDNIQYLKVDAEAAKNALGQALLPMMTKLSNDGISLLEKFTKKINATNGDATKMAEAFAEMIPEILDTFDDYAPAIGEGIGKITATIIKNVPNIIGSLLKGAFSGVGGMIEGLAESFGVEVKHMGDELAVSAVKQQDELKRLQSAYDDAKAKFGDMSDEAKTAARELCAANAEYSESSQYTVNQLLAEVDRANKAHDDLVESYNESIAATDAEAASAGKMIEKLEALIIANDGTSESMSQIQTYVKLLNEAIPDLNLLYDEQTNSLNMTTTAIWDNVDALRAQLKLENARETLKGLYSEQDTLENDYKFTKAQAEAAKKAFEEYDGNEGAYLLDLRDRIGMGYTGNAVNDAYEYLELQHAAEKTALAAAKAYEAYASNQYNIAKTEKDIIDYSDQYETSTSAISEAAKKNAQGVIAQISAIGTVTKESKTAIEAARKAYDALGIEYKNSVTNIGALTAAEREYALVTKETSEVSTSAAEKNAKAAEKTAKAAEKSAATQEKSLDSLVSALAEANEEIQTELDKLQAKYDAAFNSAKSSLGGHSDLFEQLRSASTKNLEALAEREKAAAEDLKGVSEEQVLSVNAMIKALESQARAAEEYRENLTAAQQYGLDERMLIKLSDGSDLSKSYLATIVDEYERVGSQSGLMSKLNRAFENAELEKNMTADIIAEMTTGLDKATITAAQDALAEYAAGGVMTDEISSAMYDLGLSMDAAIADGIAANADTIFAGLTDTSVAQLLDALGYSALATSIMPDFATHNTINHTGTIRVEGVNDSGDVVATSEIVMEELVTRIAREVRMI